MATAGTHDKPLQVALIGNPNTGKSTLFNALSGQNVRTGNFPGVTVEAKLASLSHQGRTLQLIDLPGTYSLAPRSLDEMVAVDVLLGLKTSIAAPEVVVCVVDAANLERNLYLFTQLLDLHLPMVLVLNMWDNAGQRGVTIDLAALKAALGVEIVTTVAATQTGLDELKSAIVRAASQPTTTPLPPPAGIATALQQLRSCFASPPAEFLLFRGLLDVHGEAERRLTQLASPGVDFACQLANTREQLATDGFRIPMAESRWRYDWIRSKLTGTVNLGDRNQRTLSDRIDRVLTHQFFGIAVFALTMLLIFQAIYTWAGPLMGGIEALQESIAGLIGSVLPPGILRSLLVDGGLAGVGGVVVFLPQILLLFLFISILEDCGYMARAAFLADRLMAPLGLNGRSFVPLMSSFACAVPGIMATRTIENWRDRMVTILIAPLMSCSARLPVYILLTTAFIPNIYLGGSLSVRALVLFGMHLVGLTVAIPVAWLLRKYYFQGETSLFVMEMPPYKWPSWKIVLGRVTEQGREFLVRAGTLIFATSLLIWAAAYFPGDHTRLHQVEAEIEQTESSAGQIEAQLAELAELNSADQLAQIETLRTELDALNGQLDPLLAEQHQLSGQLIEQSYLGQGGHFIAPAIRPLGWDWRIGVAVIASFPAREVVIAAMGTIYSLGGEVDEADAGLMAALQSSKWPNGQPIYTIPVALSIMVFFALCSQCAATLMVIKRETNSWRWPLFTFVYMTTLAYLGALLTTQLGSLL